MSLAFCVQIKINAPQKAVISKPFLQIGRCNADLLVKAAQAIFAIAV